MTDRKYSSNAQATTLSADVNNSTTTIPVVATTGFPATPFTLALDYGTAQQEVVLVTGVAGLNLTVTRGYDSTTAQSHTLGAVVKHVHIALDFRDSRNHENASSGVHGATGAVVGTTDAQTLSNKTIALGSNTVSGTKAQFNTAITDADMATLAGSETLTNKTVDLSSNTVTMTKAQLNAAVSDADVATLTGSETLTNKTLTSPVLNDPTINGVGSKVFIYKATTEQLPSSTTYQDDDVLTFAAVANATYLIRQGVLCQPESSGGGANGGMKVQIVMPTGATGRIADSNGNSMAASPINALTLAANTDSVVHPLINSVIVKTSGTAGNVTLQWAQSTSDAHPAQVLASSYWIVERVA